MNPRLKHRSQSSRLLRFRTAVHRLLFGRVSRWRAERLEEREWRRRIILASRKIQQVQLALGEDLEDVRSLRANLDRSTPGLERLEAHVTRAEALFGGIEDKLGAHTHALQGGLDRLAEMGITPPPPDDAPSREEVDALEAKVRELQIYAGGRDDLCQEKDREIARIEEEAKGATAALLRSTMELDVIKSEVEENARELSRQRDELYRERDQEFADLTTQLEEARAAHTEHLAKLETSRSECEEKHVHELEELRPLLEAQQQRVAELEASLAGKDQVESLEIAHLREELEGLHRMSAAKMEDLEAQNRLLAAKPDSLAARHEQEVSALREQAARRVAEFELQIRRLEATQEELRSTHARELKTLREESEWRIQILEERSRMLEEGRAEVEKARATAQCAAEDRLADLEKQLRGERVREQKIAELEAELTHLRAAPAPAPGQAGDEARVQELEAEVSRLTEVRAQLDVVHVHEVARVKRGFREKITALEQAVEHAKEQAPPAGATPGSAPDAGAVVRLEAKLQEKEAMFALLSSRNEDLERRVNRLTEQLGGETTWPAEPHFPAGASAQEPEAGALMKMEGESSREPSDTPAADPPSHP